MPQVSRPFPLAPTATATTTILATTPFSGVIRSTMTAAHTTAVSTAIAPTCTGATTTRTTASQSVAFAIRADRKSAQRQSGLKGKPRRKAGENILDFQIPSP